MGKSKSEKSLKADFKQAIDKVKYLPGEMREKLKLSIEEAQKISIE